jgi:hypothetical protein
MGLVNTISQTETIDLLNKCWMTHDGMWFLHCLLEFGIEATNKINKSAIKSLSPIEINRIKNALGIDKNIENFDDFRLFFESVSQFMIPDFMNVSFSYPGENKMAWEFNQGKCFAYTGIKRMGAIDMYECGVLYRIKCWLEELGIKHRFKPEIGRCLMYHHGSCSGNIRLFFEPR